MESEFQEVIDMLTQHIANAMESIESFRLLILPSEILDFLPEFLKAEYFLNSINEVPLCEMAAMSPLELKNCLTCAQKSLKHSLLHPTNMFNMINCSQTDILRKSANLAAYQELHNLYGWAIFQLNKCIFKNDSPG